MKTITYTVEADKFLSKQSAEVAVRIEAKIEQYVLTSTGDVKALKGSPTLRLRVGDYRVIFTEDLIVIEIIEIGHRSKIYT